MKLLNLQIRGYRSLKEIAWRPGDLNLIIGPNGSGKTNLLKGLELLSRSSMTNMDDLIANEGGMNAVTWDGSTGRIQYQLLMDFVKPEVKENSECLYELELAQTGKSSAFIIEKEILEVRNQDVSGETRKRPWLFRTPQGISVTDGDPPQLRTYELSAPEQETETLIDMMGLFFTRPTDPDVQFKSSLNSWKIYQNFQTHSKSSVRGDAVSRRETIVDTDGSNLLQVLHTLYSTSREFKKDLNRGMRTAFGEDFEELIFPPSADQRIQLRLRWRSLKREQSSADLSDGTLRFLYLIAILANPNPPALIAIDEPETGLHPSMLPIIAEYARNASLHSQIIFTTHSAEFLDAFSQFDPTITVVTNREGATHLQVLEGEKLRYWLSEYTLGKLYRSGELENQG